MRKAIDILPTVLCSKDFLINDYTVIGEKALVQSK